MNWSSHANGDNDFFGTFEDFGFEDDHPLGEGYLEASGNVIRLKEFSMMSEGNIAAVFHDNGDVTGAYGEFAGFMDNNNQFHDVMAFYKYKVDKSEKVYCRSYLSAVELTFAMGPSGGGGSYDGSAGGGDAGGGDAGAGGSSPGVVYWVEVDGALTTTMCSDQNGDGTVDEATECCEDLDRNFMCDNTQSNDIPIDPPEFDPLTDDAVTTSKNPNGLHST